MSTLITNDQDQGEIMQVVIKEGELGSLAPLGGDENTIRAQQVFKSDSMLWWEMLSHGVVVEEGVFDKQGIVKENEKVAN